MGIQIDLCHVALHHYPFASAIPLTDRSQQHGAGFPPRAQEAKNFRGDANSPQRKSSKPMCTSQSRTISSAIAPQSATPMLTGRFEDSRETEDGHDGAAAGEAGERARGDCGAGGELQGDAGEIRARARRIFRHHLAQCLCQWAAAVLVVKGKKEKPGARRSGLRLTRVTCVTSDDSSGGD